MGGGRGEDPPNRWVTPTNRLVAWVELKRAKERKCHILKELWFPSLPLNLGLQLLQLPKQTVAESSDRLSQGAAH